MKVGAGRLHLAGLWRYPVKSLAGEALTEVAIGPEGVASNRLPRMFRLVEHQPSSPLLVPLQVSRSKTPFGLL
jgi:hypothetical protein